MTNSSGNYTYPNLPPGVYRVTVEVPGFKKGVHAAINLAVDSTARADLQLSPGNVSESIEVTAEAQVLKTDRADISTTVDAVQVQELPSLFNGNYQAMLLAGPRSIRAHRAALPVLQRLQFVQMNSYGQPRQSNNYQIEGIDNNERTGLLQIMIPPKEAIQQVNASTSNHDVEMGRGTGAVTNVVLKTGTNSIHGGVYWNLQNSATRARTFFNPSVGHIAYNQVGGNIGGPIKKNKLFYFADYLKTMDHEANTNLHSVPSMEYRAGDFSADTTHIVYDPFSARHGHHQWRGPHSVSRQHHPGQPDRPDRQEDLLPHGAAQSAVRAADPDQQLSSSCCPPPRPPTTWTPRSITRPPIRTATPSASAMRSR